MATAVDLDQLDFIEPDGYVNRGYPHDVWTRLRAEEFRERGLLLRP